MSIINRLLFNSNDYHGIVGVINVLLKISYILSIFVVLIVTVFYMIIRFYKNLLTDEGYLMFTLPGKAHQLITSKLLITLLWVIVSIVTVLISLFIMFGSSATLPDFMNGMKEFTTALNREFGGNSAFVIIEIIIMILLALVFNILFIYVSIAIGQLFSKHKIIGSFLAYMALYTAIQVLMVILLISFGLLMPESLPASVVPQMIFPIIMVILTLGSTCFYLGTNYIFKRKLNLD
jgi:hypothetical protein